jgi:branched-chain amino acid transport system permease protein
MSSFMQYLFAGLSTGAIYALIAIGWVLIFNVSGVLNLAQGELLMIGGLVFAWLAIHTEMPVIAGLLLGIAAAIGVAVVLDVVAVRRVKSKDLVPLILVTLGASFALREIGRLVFGADSMRHEYLVGGAPINILGASLLPQAVLTWVIVAVVVGALWLFFRHTLYGKAMIACSDDPVGAQASGISPRRMRTIAFAISGALAGLGGALIISLTSLSWDGGTMIGLKGFIAAAFGGLGRYEGAVVGGLTLGLLEAFGAGYVSSAYKDVFSLGLLVVLLLLRPQGLLGGRVITS